MAVVSVLSAAVALISCLSVESKRAIRRLPRAAWVAVILLLPVLGAVAWFLFGRPLSLPVARTGFWRRFRNPDGRSGAPAPDDDPEFLESLDQDTDRGREADEQGRPPPAAG